MFCLNQAVARLCQSCLGASGLVARHRQCRFGMFTEQIHFIRLQAHQYIASRLVPNWQMPLRPSAFIGLDLFAQRLRTIRYRAPPPVPVQARTVHRHGIYRWGQPVTASQTQGQQAGPTMRDNTGHKVTAYPSWVLDTNQKQATGRATNNRPPQEDTLAVPIQCGQCCALAVDKCLH